MATITDFEAWLDATYLETEEEARPNFGIDTRRPHMSQ
jgi:hypothetical protein